MRKAIPKAQPKQKQVNREEVATASTPSEYVEPTQEEPTQEESTPKEFTLNDLNVQQRRIRQNMPPPQPLMAKVQIQRKPIVPPKGRRGG